MASFVRSTRGCKHKVAEDGPVRGSKEGNKNVWAFAGGNKRGAHAIGGLPFMYCRCRIFEWVPMMDVSGSLRHLVRDEKGNMM